MEARAYIQQVGGEVSDRFVRSRTLLSFEDYLQLVLQSPRHHLRNAAQYLVDAIDAQGSYTVPHPQGAQRRFKLFDGDGTEGRVAGQEEVQNALYRVLQNFVRAGRINKLILLHGPNGSAKSTLVDALKRGMEQYSATPEGAVYTFNWIFPADKAVKGSIGFSEKSGLASLATFAHLAAEAVEARLTNPLRDHPLLLLPQDARKALMDQALAGAPAHRGFILPDYLLHGELSQKSRRIYEALLSAYGGDYLKVLRHVQVERFYISRRYQSGTATVEPHMSVDASYQQLTADRSVAALPVALHNVALFEPFGPLVSANRGLIEYADLLKRPLEAFKYLLGASETGEIPLEHFILELDEVLIASSNEKHLAAFKEVPDFASFKGRIELIRVPYLRRVAQEEEIYRAQIHPQSVGKHVAPHALRVAATWAVLTRLKRPVLERYPHDARTLLDKLTPLEKLKLYHDGTTPQRHATSEARTVRKLIPALYDESESYPHYEGRTGASAREIKTALLNAAQSPDFDSLHPLAVTRELRALCRDKSVYEFLQQEAVDGYHEHEAFVDVVEAEYLDWVDAEVNESMGLVTEASHRELFERYILHVSHWVKGEKLQNKLTGQFEKPDETRMAEFEALVMPRGEDAGSFRKGLIASVGAHRMDNPEGELDFARIFPELFRKLREHYFDERKRKLRKTVENILRYLSDERNQLSSREQQQVRETLDTMAQRFGYTDTSARDAIVFLLQKRYV